MSPAAAWWLELALIGFFAVWPFAWVATLLIARKALWFAEYERAQQNRAELALSAILAAGLTLALAAIGVI